MYDFNELKEFVTNNINKAKTVFIINGDGGCGKDHLINSLKKNSIKALNASVIDPVKIKAYCNDLWNGEKDEKSRKLLHGMKHIFDEYNDYTTKYAIRIFNTFITEKIENILFIHCGEINQINILKRLFMSHCRQVYSLYIESSNKDEVCENDPRYVDKEDTNISNYDIYFLNKYSLDKKDIESIETEFAALITKYL